MVGQIFVRGQKAVLAVNNKGDDSGLFSGSVHLLQDFRLKAADTFRAFLNNGAFIQGDAPGVDDTVFRLVLAADNALQPVTCDAGSVMGDGAIAADKSVEESGLSDIGASDKDDLGKR